MSEGFNSIEDLTQAYRKLWQKTEDRSRYQFFTTWREYEEMRDLLVFRAKELGVEEKFLENIARAEICRRDQYENGSELTGGRFLRADDFRLYSARFLWRPYLPLGEYTVLMAAGGTGKTFFCCALAAQLTHGNVPLGAEGTETEPQNILIFSAEDTGGELLTSLKKCGADVSHVFISDAMNSLNMSLTQTPERFEKMILESGAKLVVIDPWQAFIGAHIDVNRVNEMRPVLQSVACIAKRTDAAIILVSHVGKKAQTENINNSAIGSTDLINAARSALYLVRDPDTKERILVHSKSNYAQEGASIRFSISQEHGVRWLGFSEIDRDMIERAAKSGKSVFRMIKENESETEELRPVATMIACLAKPFGTVRYSYDTLKEMYGTDIFCGKRPAVVIDKAMQMFPLPDYEVITSRMMRIKNANEADKYKRGVEIRYIADRT